MASLAASGKSSQWWGSQEMLPRLAAGAAGSHRGIAVRVSISPESLTLNRHGRHHPVAVEELMGEGFEDRRKPPISRRCCYRAQAEVVDKRDIGTASASFRCQNCTWPNPCP